LSDKFTRSGAASNTGLDRLIDTDRRLDHLEQLVDVPLPLLESIL
jgi:hypothetical protein